MLAGTKNCTPNNSDKQKLAVSQLINLPSGTSSQLGAQLTSHPESLNYAVDLTRRIFLRSAGQPYRNANWLAAAGSQSVAHHH